MLVVVCRLSGVDVDYRMFLSVMFVCLLVVACRLSSADFKLSGCICPWLLGVGCRVVVVDCICMCRLSPSFSIVGAQLFSPL